MNKCKGFTLIEMLAALGMFAIIIPCIILVMSSAFRNNIKDDNRFMVSNINQTSIEDLRGKGKNYLKTMLTSGNFEGYFYFNDEDTFEDALDNNIKDKTFTSGNIDDMKNNKGSNKYGLYLNMSLSNKMGEKTEGGSDVTVSDGMKVLRIEVKTYIFNKNFDYQSSILYISR